MFVALIENEAGDLSHAFLKSRDLTVPWGHGLLVLLYGLPP